MFKRSYIQIWVDEDNYQYIKPHSHHFCELVYFNKGKVITHINNKIYEVSEGSFVIIGEGIKHDEVRNEDTQTVCLIFTSNEEFESEIYTDTSGEVLKLLMSMNKEARSKLRNYNEILDYKFKELFLLIDRIKNSDNSISKDFLYAINYISDNFRQKLVLPKIAQNLNLSYSYFQHRFKQITGYPPRAFLIKRRLEEAERLLFKSNMNCTEIAYYCGFSNSAQFTAMFKKEYGLTPKDYKKKY